LDETKLTDAGIDACRGIERVGVMGEIGVVDPGVWSTVRSVAGWGEIGVANLGFWSTVGSVARWGEIGVANPVFRSTVGRGEFGVAV
jgi:hypothetical protein